MSEKKPLIHILVIGFHHKRGCQVEFSYPPLITESQGSTECPTGWKYLPTLALPDGSHNFIEDSVFFNLPSLENPNETIFGISCYRQIPVEKLKIRTADVTRSTVQKSVCALVSIPVYGYIEVKLSLIAHAFFDQGDFSQTDILCKAYDQLNACLLSSDQFSSPMQQISVGLPLRDLILKWRHKILLLFKLILLERKIVCFGSPVRPVCSLILSIVSLHPQLIEKGFSNVACVKTSRPMSPMPDFSSNISSSSEIGENYDKENCDLAVEGEEEKLEKVGEEIKIIFDEKIVEESQSETEIGKRTDKNSLPRDVSVDAIANVSLAPLCAVNSSSWGAPLPIFTNGNLCLPYLSLPYMDLLSDPSVLGYIIGTSNILFQQKRQLIDVLIDVDGALMETQDQDLRKQLILTTEDLRFIDFLIRHIQNPKEDAEGSEFWIREQFQGYMTALLRTSILTDGSKELEHFNGSFLAAWKKTQSYEEWLESKPDDESFLNTPAGHPFSGTLSVADMKLRISQTMHNTESGRKINQAVNNTSRAVGGALSQAKGALTNWWSSMTTAPSIQATESVDEAQEEPEESEEPEEATNLEIEVKLVKEKVNNNKKLEIIEEKENDKEKLIEIADEAEILDSNRKVGGIFTV